MKKLYTTLLTIAATALSIQAQQLPNVGFENWKTECGNSESFGDKTGMVQRPNTEPADWNGSSVNQTVKVIININKKEQLVFEADGKNGKGVKLKNVYIGAGSIGSVAPGYISFGTPWVNATASLSKCDGGTYGGMNYTYRPDAIIGDFKRVDTNDEVSHIIVYAWKGTFKSNVGEKSNPTNERDDVDRAIMARDNAHLTSNSNGTRIAYADYTFKSTANNGWETIVVPLTYENNSAPEKINVVVCSGDYWTRDNMKDQTELHADNVRMLFYSRLSALSVNGTPVNGFDPDNFAYTIDAEMPADASAISYTTMGNSGSTTENVALDKENAQVLVTVKNDYEGGTDIDGETSHTYTLQFNKNNLETPEDPTDKDAYKGSLHVVIKDMDMDTTQDDQTVYIENTGAGKCIFSLPNFSFGDIPVGDILLNDVKVTENADGTFSYSGSAQNMKLGPDKDEEGNDVPDEGKLDVDVTLTGTIDATGKAQMIISVIWHLDEETAAAMDLPLNVPIDVEFNGQGPKPTAAIDDITVDNSNAPVEYYNLQGMRVNASNLTPGIYIRRQGTEVTKIYVR